MGKSMFIALQKIASTHMTWFAVHIASGNFPELCYGSVEPEFSILSGSNT